MNTKKRLFASALVIALAAMGVLISGGHNVAKAGPGATQVSIASPLPLPITGTATVSGTVGATQSGTWNMGISGTPSINIANSPAVSLAGTPTVNANVTFPASQGVTVTAAGPLTNVGRLPSKQVMLEMVNTGMCPSTWLQIAADGSATCFDMANHAGEVLVITDLFWTGFTSPATTCTVGLGPNTINAYLSSGATSGSDGVAFKSEHLTTGVTLTVNPFVVVTKCGFSVVNLTGYLMPNQ